MNLVLMGLRGSGKTTIGRAVAERLGWAFVDLDDVTPRLLGGGTVAKVWRDHGEAAFRKAEAGALRQVLATDRQVVALGGGTPTAPGAGDLLRAGRDAGRIVLIYLAAEARTLRSRLGAADNAQRPSLTGSDPLAEVDAVLARRDPLYRELASDVVETDGLNLDDAVDDVCRAIGGQA